MFKITNLLKSELSHSHISEKRGFIKSEKLKDLIITSDKHKIKTIHLGYSSNYSNLNTIELNPDSFLSKYMNEGILIDSKNFYNDLEGKEFLNRPKKLFLLKPDLNTIRKSSWLKNESLLIFGDVINPETNTYSEVSPRGILKKRLSQLDHEGLTLNCASELEYYLFQKTYSENKQKGLFNLKEIGCFTEDYLLQQGDLLEYLNEEYRVKLKDSGIHIENTKGEAAVGQHEINMKYSDALSQSDNALVLKCAMKAISEKNNSTITFMAKPDINKAGSSCHLHLSLYDKEGKNIFIGDDYRLNDNLTCSNNLLYFLGGIMKYSLDTFIMFAPTINSYRRYKSFSWAPTNLDSWSYDNRTSPFRICGEGNNLRIEYRPPGGDANQYLSYSAVIAAGLKGLKEKIRPPEMFKGSSYENKDFKKPPVDLSEAVEIFKESEFIKENFTIEEREFLLSFYENEVIEYEKNVTDWEHKRYFSLI